MKAVFGWIYEREVPFHHTTVSRCAVVIVDQSGHPLVEDYEFDSKEEAEEALEKWIRTHPFIKVTRLDKASCECRRETPGQCCC